MSTGNGLGCWEYPHEQGSRKCESGHLCFLYKKNTVLRSGLSLEKVFAIPNVVDTPMFKLALERLKNDQIVIVVISRLVYRKGADLLLGIERVEIWEMLCYQFEDF
ncbi:hypothetical protein Dimus_011367 [Dionaea muscipula]